MTDYSFEINIYHDFNQTIFIDETLFRVGKAKQRKWRK